MKTIVLNRIPGKKAKDRLPENKIQNPAQKIETAGENIPQDAQPGSRERLDDKHRKSEARKTFEAAVRGKLKYSGKR
ncbi:MAG: hypothetical protein PHI34_15200 [Acidobacteriota bacterium]|nr:hypothetical protein [Acidobacteriota bacterium]